MIEVRLFATFREGREKVLFLDPNSYKNAYEVLDYLQIPYEDVAIYLINGRHSKLDDHIKEGDILAIFPPVGGGWAQRVYTYNKFSINEQPQEVWR